MDDWRDKQIHVTDNAEEALGKFRTSLFKLFDDIEKMVEFRESVNDGAPQTIDHYTRRMINDWFLKNGGL